MDEMRFADVMSAASASVSIANAKRSLISKGLKNKFGAINRELAAIDAYEAAKTGKTATPTRPPRSPQRARRQPNDHLRSLVFAHKEEAGGKPC